MWAPTRRSLRIALGLDSRGDDGYADGLGVRSGGEHRYHHGEPAPDGGRGDVGVDAKAPGLVYPPRHLIEGDVRLPRRAGDRDVGAVRYREFERVQGTPVDVGREAGYRQKTAGITAGREHLRRPYRDFGRGHQRRKGRIDGDYAKRKDKDRKQYSDARTRAHSFHCGQPSMGQVFPSSKKCGAVLTRTLPCFVKDNKKTRMAVRNKQYVARIHAFLATCGKLCGYGDKGQTKLCPFDTLDEGRSFVLLCC